MAELLAIEHLAAGHGAAVVIADLSLTLAGGESLAVLGRNGMGKTTLLDSIIGATRRLSGSVRLEGREVAGLASERRAALGVGWVPQERNIFRSLTVEENLTAVARPGPWDLAKAYALFPRLKERRSNLGYQLSGGEQQMLAVARALVLNPKLLLLDEPTEGLAPILVQELLAALRRIVRDEGLSALIVEQHARRILDVADRAIVLERGAIVLQASSAILRADPVLLERHLGVARATPAAAPSSSVPGRSGW